MPPTKVDHTNTICCICGNNYTSSVWYKNTKGNWDRKSYRCAKCNSKIKRSEVKETKKKDIKNAREDIKCCKCDTDITSTDRYNEENK